ncbi:MAG: ABC transporter ATP-binding protein [Leptolyngbya sp. Prado105]|jgi:NitT/TauT family transport system ATP-binding protein|nr:ABC transporter ATP-binding protein [Leptolyngbya sp. Prado105]
MKLTEALPTVLSCQNLSKSFRGSHKQETVVLTDINLEICKGTFVTILGQSGGGKSTLLKLLGGFLSSSSGKVVFNGQLLKGNTPDIGMIFQDHNLYPWMTVEQNVGFGFKIKGEKPGKYKHLVHEILDTVGLSHARKLYPHQLSGGMRQRVAIARSIVVNPTVLLLDEPFSALDVQLRRRLQEFLLALWSEMNTTMILVTHNVEEAILLGQNLVVVGDSPGRIVEEVQISDAQYRDRYHPDFLRLQRYLESVLEGTSKEQENGYCEEILATPRIRRN